MHRVLLLNGPNLNLLGTREPAIYGAVTLPEITRAVHDAAQARGAEVRAVQSNSEGALIDALHDARTWANGVILNAGALTHYSYSLVDAVIAIGIPVVEVHISNIHARESWRHVSLLAPVVKGSVIGFGWRGYVLALNGLLDRLAES
jgi:3-dehydroquinate dehydratase-2